MSVKPEDPAPLLAPALHLQIKDRLTEAILSGELPPGAVLPAELELAQSYGIAVGTLRRALTALTEEGLIARRRRTGTVVTGRSPQLSLRFLLRYYRLHGLDGRLVQAQSRSLSVGVSAAEGEEARALELAEGTPLLRFRRLRLVEGRAAMLDDYAIAAERLPGPVPAQVPSQLYLHFEAEGIRLAAAREMLSAELCPQAAEALGLPEGTPLLRIDELAYDAAGRPVVLARHHADTSRHRYVSEIR